MKRQRRGTIIVAVLVGLLVISTLAVQLTRSVVLRQRQIRTSENQSQSLWIAESAIGRARSRLISDSQYRGETWQIPADQITGEKGATVEIMIGQAADGSEGRLVSVEAFYPAEGANRIATKKTTVIQLPKQGESDVEP